MFGLSIRSVRPAAAVANTLNGRAALMHARNRVAMERVVRSIERDVKKDGLSGKAGSHPLFGETGATGDALASVTGHTRRSLVAMVFTRLLHVVGVVGSPLASFALHEFGGTVQGRKYLRIPTKYMKKASGQDKLAGRSARTLPNTAIFKSKAGNLFIWQVSGARAKNAGKPIPLYLLKPSIKYRARHMLRNALRKNRGIIKRSFRASFSTIKNG